MRSSAAPVHAHSSNAISAGRGYAWAERALKCGYPERFAQQALGHNSKAVHHACSRNAEVTVPSLDDWEKQWQRGAGAGRQRTDDGGQKTEDAGAGWDMPKPKLVPVDFQARLGASDAGGELEVGTVAR